MRRQCRQTCAPGPLFRIASEQPAAMHFPLGCGAAGAAETPPQGKPLPQKATILCLYQMLPCDDPFPGCRHPPSTARDTALCTAATSTTSSTRQGQPLPSSWASRGCRASPSITAGTPGDLSSRARPAGRSSTQVPRAPEGPSHLLLILALPGSFPRSSCVGGSCWFLVTRRRGPRLAPAAIPSGDTRPSGLLQRAGRGATLLIHEVRPPRMHHARGVGNFHAFPAPFLQGCCSDRPTPRHPILPTQD